jgi:hypothetical protein
MHSRKGGGSSKKFLSFPTTKVPLFHPPVLFDLGYMQIGGYLYGIGEGTEACDYSGQCRSTGKECQRVLSKWTDLLSIEKYFSTYYG